MARSRRPYTKLTCPSPTTTTGARGLPLASTPETRSQCTHKTSSLRSLAKLEEAQVVPFHTIATTSSQPEGPTTSLQPILIDDNGTPATWTFGLVFQQATDRQDRTQQTEGRFSLLELHWRYHDSLVYRNPPPDKDSSQDEMPCRHPSIEATTPAPATVTTRPSCTTTPRRRQTSHRDSLCIAPVIKYQPPS